MEEKNSLSHNQEIAIIEADIKNTEEKKKDQDRVLFIAKKMLKLQPILLTAGTLLCVALTPSNPSLGLYYGLSGSIIAVGFTSVYFGIVYPIARIKRRKHEKRLAALEKLKDEYTDKIVKEHTIVKTDTEIMAEIQTKSKEELEKLVLESPEQARVFAIESLKQTGILDESEELKAPYNGEYITSTDFTRGPKLTRKKNK